MPPAAQTGKPLAAGLWVRPRASQSRPDLQRLLQGWVESHDPAARTAPAFRTDDAIERSADFWQHDDDGGFLLSQGQPLIDVLRAAAQLEATGRLYDFSCHRATDSMVSTTGAS